MYLSSRSAKHCLHSVVTTISILLYLQLLEEEDVSFMSFFMHSVMTLIWCHSEDDYEVSVSII